MVRSSSKVKRDPFFCVAGNVVSRSQIRNPNDFGRLSESACSRRAEFVRGTVSSKWTGDTDVQEQEQVQHEHRNLETPGRGNPATKRGEGVKVFVSLLWILCSRCFCTKAVNKEKPGRRASDTIVHIEEMQK